jgi:hypothetical protein
MARQKFHFSRKIEGKRNFRRQRMIVQQSISEVYVVRQDWLQEAEDRLQQSISDAHVVRQEWLQEAEDKVWWQELQDTVQNFLSSIKNGEFLY